MNVPRPIFRVLSYYLFSFFFFYPLYLHAAAIPLLVSEIEVYFSPDGGAMAAVCAEIEKAESTVKIAAYSISHPAITREVLAARDRGVHCSIIVTPTQQSDKFSSAGKLKKAGISTRVDREHTLFHNKYIIIDAKTVVTGSMNFSVAGDTKNAENTLIIRNAAVAALFTDNWYVHLNHSGTFKPILSRDYRPPLTPPHLELKRTPARR